MLQITVLQLALATNSAYSSSLLYVLWNGLCSLLLFSYLGFLVFMSYYYSILFFLFIMHLYFKCLRFISLPFSVPSCPYTLTSVSSMLSLPCLFVFVYVQLMCLSMLVFYFHVHYFSFPVVSTPLITLQCIHCITFTLPAHFPILPFITFPV